MKPPNTKSPVQSSRKSPRNTTPKQKFTRRRDAVNRAPAPPEYLPKSEVKKINWLPRQFCDNQIPFKGDTTLPEELRELKTPWQFFNYFFTPELVERIHEETVRYSIEKNIQKSLALEVDEIYRFFGICIMSSVVHLPNLRKYWSPNIGIDVVKETMTVNRFEKVRQYLHFNNNSILNDEYPIHATEQADRLFKIRPLISMLLERFQTVPPAEKLSLDEQVCATKNRTYLKNYLQTSQMGI